MQQTQKPEKVWMQGPKGELVDVDGTPETLTPLMVQGYRQVPAPTQADSNAKG